MNTTETMTRDQWDAMDAEQRFVAYNDSESSRNRYKSLCEIYSSENAKLTAKLDALKGIVAAL